MVIKLNKILFIILLIFIIIVSLFTLYKYSLLEYSDDMTDYVIFNNIKNTYTNNTQVNDLVIKCSDYDTDIEQLECIHTDILNNFKYVRTRNIVPPNKLYKNGGDCKSWTILYAATLDRLDIPNNFVIGETHIYVSAWLDNEYHCTIDQQYIRCD